MARIWVLAGMAIRFLDRHRQAGGRGCHVAFAAPDRATVDAFHAAALAAGGATTARRGCGRIITPAITVPLCWTMTATISRPSITETRHDHLSRILFLRRRRL